MGPLIFRVFVLLSVVGGYRPARSPVDLSNDDIDTPARDQKETGNKMWEASRRIVQCKPQNNQGRLIGIHYATHSGEILLVDHASPAEAFGLKEGEYIIKVNDAPFSMATCDEAIKAWRWRAATINFTVETPPAALLALLEIAKAVDFSLGLVGALLTISVPWLLAKAWVGDLEVSPENLNSSVMFSVLGAMTLRACRDFMVLCVEWSYVGVRTKLFELGMLAKAIAILMICLRNRRNPLLDTMLRADLTAELKKMDCVLWVMCVGFALFRCTRAVLGHTREGLPSASLDILRECASVPVGFGLLIVGRIVSRMATAARQALIEVSEKLPCEAKLFEQDVHKPCANVLKDTSQNLATCGGPLLGLAFELAMTMFRLYEQVVYMAGFRFSMWLSFPEYLMGLAARVCWIAGASSALVVPFLQLSRGQRALERGLWKTRKDDSALHVQVQAVESMLVEVNDGQGWGFPVFVGFVLTKPLMQTLFLRALLAGTVIKAFLDHELGLQEEEGLDVSAQMFTIAGGLQRNISGSLQNQSSALKELLIQNLTT